MFNEKTRFHVFNLLRCFVFRFSKLFISATKRSLLLSTHADRQGVDISVTACLRVCLCVCMGVCVCTVTDFSAKDKANGVKFRTAVHRRPRPYYNLTFWGTLLPRSPKLDESAWPARWPIRPIKMRRSWNIARRVVGVWT